MTTNFRLHIDPVEVLGVSRDATIKEIRDAYRSKAKLYHPDVGGEAWAFRVLSQAYEVLSTARVAARADRFEDVAPAQPRRPEPAASTPPPFSTGTPPPRRPAGATFTTEPPRAQSAPRSESHESVRPGVQETSIEPAQVVDVEKVLIRYEVEHIWLITEHSREDRLLSCCLNITWPDPESGLTPSSIPYADGVLKGLNEVFEALRTSSRATSARSSVLDGRFTGWLSFVNDEQANAAFALLRDRLHGVGLVVKQWTRDLVVPRQWR